MLNRRVVLCTFVFLLAAGAAATAQDANRPVFRVRTQETTSDDVRAIHVSEYVVRPDQPPMPIMASPLYQPLDRIEGVEAIAGFMRYGVIIKKGSAFRWEDFQAKIFEVLRQHLAPNLELALDPPLKEKMQVNIFSGLNIIPTPQVPIPQQPNQLRPQGTQSKGIL